MKFKVIKTNLLANSDIFQSETGHELFTIDGEFYIEGVATQEEADKLMAAHIPAVPVDTATAKAALLARIGITAEEAQLLLS
jgi:hypothetical protein